MINFHYNKIYNRRYFESPQLHGLEAWKQRTLKFSDNLAALCYAMYIPWQQLVKNFPIVFRNNDDGDEFDHPYTIEHIIEFLKLCCMHNPKGVLEVGGGRGELSNLMTHLNIPHLSVEVCLDADDIYKNTGLHYFGSEHKHQSPMIGPIEVLLQENKIDLSRYDTIIFPESVEHIPTPNFTYVMSRIRKEFKGRFIVTNGKSYHPIIGSLDHPDRLHETMEEHVADVNDEVYARWTSMAKKLIYKDGSHLVLEF